METITIVAHPNSKHPRVEEDLTGQIHVYVSAPPLEGKANAAVIEALATYYAVKKSAVRILSGQTAKYKRVEIWK